PNRWRTNKMSLVVLSMTSTARNTTMTGPSTEDRLNIYELYARCSWELDTGDSEGYVALFTPDEEATEETREGGLEVRRGHDEIRKLVLKFTKRAAFHGY